MKKSMVLCLLFALVAPLLAVEGNQVMYTGGTVAALTVHTIGHLDTTSETALGFESSGARLLIPYADIQSFEYSTDVAHHLGVVAGVAIALLKKRERRHFFRITYLGPDHTTQVAVFEVPKQMPRTLEAVLHARAPQACKPCSLRASHSSGAPE
jgi:hypothetical protein